MWDQGRVRVSTMVGAGALVLALAVPAISLASHAHDVTAITRDVMRANGLQAAIVRVAQPGQPTITRALGQSMTGVPARADMRVRIGSISMPYVTTVLLQLQEEGRLRLDDPVGKWLPYLPNADRVTLRMLANFTAGYPDYEQSPALQADFEANPFRRFTQSELLAYAFASPPMYEPGTSWSYAHTNYVLLGRVIRKVTGMRLGRVIHQRILMPLHLDATASNDGPGIVGPVLHAFDGERGTYEESTFWNPSWTLASGAIMTSNISDMARTATAVGTGELLSRSSYRQMMAPTTAGMGPLTQRIYYGLGVSVRGGWILQNPLFGGYGGVAAYLPSRHLSIATVATAGPTSAVGVNFGYRVFQDIAARLAPEAPVPDRP